MICSPSLIGTAVSVKPNGQVTVCGSNPSVVDHVLMRSQTNRQCGWTFSKQRAERVFVFFAVMRQLPKFQRPDRESQPGRFAKNALVIPK